MVFLKQSGFYLLGRIVPAAVGVGGIAIYTRLLDPASIGAFALLMSISLLAGAIGFTWLRIAALRVAAGHVEGLEPNFTATIGVLFVATALVVALVEAVAIHVYLPAVAPAPLALAVLAAVAAAWYDLNASLLQARLRVAAWGGLNLARAILAVAASVLLIFAGWKTNALLGGFVVGNVATLAFVALWRPALRGRFDPKIFWRCFHFGWPQSVNAIQSYLTPVIARGMLQIAAGSGAVGIFAVAQDFSTQTIASVVGSVSLAGIPLAFRAKERGDAAALAEQLRANARLIFGIALPATAGFVLLAQPLAHTFFGARFWDGAGIILALVGVAAFAVNLRVYYFDQAFELAMQTRPQAIIAVIGTLVALAATFVLVPRYAAVGAAVAVLIACVASLGLSIVWGMRVLRMPVPLDDWARTAFATAGMALALVLLPKENNAFGLGVALCIGAAVYIALSSATRFAFIRAQFGHRLAWRRP